HDNDMARLRSDVQIQNGPERDARHDHLCLPFETSVSKIRKRQGTEKKKKKSPKTKPPERRRPPGAHNKETKRENPKHSAPSVENLVLSDKPLRESCRPRRSVEAPPEGSTSTLKGYAVSGRPPSPGNSPSQTMKLDNQRRPLEDPRGYLRPRSNLLASCNDEET